MKQKIMKLEIGNRVLFLLPISYFLFFCAPAFAQNVKLGSGVKVGGGGGSGTVTSVSMPSNYTVTNPTTAAAATFKTPAQSNLVFDPNAPFIYTSLVRRQFVCMPNNATFVGSCLMNWNGNGTGTPNVFRVAPSANDPLAFQLFTSGTSGAGLYVIDGGAAAVTSHRTGRTNGMVVLAEGRLEQTVTERAWMIAVTDQSGTTMLASDVPAGNYVGIIYSTTGTYTGLTDTTHFVFVAKNGTTQTAVASTVLANTAGHKFALWEDISGAKWHAYIDGAEVGTGISTNLPASGTNVAQFSGIQTLAAVSAQYNIWQQELFEDSK